jgi:acyl-CoA ligase (AMP-forming) (exosortase A-associated)
MDLLHEMLGATAAARPDAPAVTDRTATLTYGQLARAVEAAASGLMSLGVGRGDRVAVWLPKRNEKVVALYAAMHAGGIAVPINVLLKPPQVAHILGDSGAKVLVTTSARLADLVREVPERLGSLGAVVTVDSPAVASPQHTVVLDWAQLLGAAPQSPPGTMDSDVAAFFYTSGSTGRPKGVVLSHHNMAAGARSVSGYLGNTPDDRLLALLSFSFDYGFSQLTTAFAVGASVVLIEYSLPQEVLLTLERERVTGLAAVPPVWIQLADLRWPESVPRTLRYITNSGGAMPRPTLARLREALPQTRVFLMYGLTEAFRSTYLPPEELDRRPDSIGKAIPDAEILVLRPDGTRCDDDEPGELVHRGPLVSLGYWKDPERTAERFRPVPPVADGLQTNEMEVWSGDIVRRDADGFLYFIGRRDEMIKTSGMRVSPTEVEEEAYATGLVGDAVAVGVPHALLGQSIVLVASAAPGSAGDTDALLDALRRRLPRFMVPLTVDWRDALPRNANGKFDRALLRQELMRQFAEFASQDRGDVAGQASRSGLEQELQLNIG